MSRLLYTRRWFGTPGHFIAAKSCCFHLHTRIGDYRISTVGCYHPADPERQRKPQEIGSGRLYETMVFELDDKGEPVDWTGCDSDAYNDGDAAEAGHLAMCEKWEASWLGGQETLSIRESRRSPGQAARAGD